MKKFVLTTLALGLLVGCSAKNDTNKLHFSQQDLVGEWFCLTKYPEIRTETFEQINLSADGAMFGHANIEFMLKETAVLRYQRTAQGRWQLENNQLIYTFQTQDVKKAHANQLEKALNNKQQLAKDKALQKLKQLDDNFFKVYSNQAGKTQEVHFDVLEVKPKTSFLIVQKTDKGKYATYCLSPQSVSKQK